MRLRFVVPLLVVVGAVVAPGATAAPRLGTPEVLTGFAGSEPFLRASVSAAGHADAYAVFSRRVGRNVSSVLFGDDRGRVHRFDLTLTGAASPEAIRLVALEGGAGMALWDDPEAGRILARRWRADGTLGVTSVVLDGVIVVRSGDTTSPQWHAVSDPHGTVVVATTGAAPRDPTTVVVAAREPGGAFGPAQELATPGAGGLDPRELDLSPLGPDGSVTVSWGALGGDGTSGRATRAGKGPFGPPEAAPFAPAPAPGPAAPTGVTVDGQPYAMSAAVARLCPCASPRVFTWADGTRVLTFKRYGTRTAATGDLYVARAGDDRTFDRADRASTNSYAQLVRRPRPGEVGVAVFDTNTDFNRFRRRSRLVVLPYGPAVPPSRRAPAAEFGTSASAAIGRLLAPVSCDRVCTVGGSAPGHRLLRLVDSGGRAVGRRLEAFTVAYLRVPVAPGARRIPVVLRAVDDAGHRRVVRRAFRARARGRRWCLVGASRC